MNKPKPKAKSLTLADQTAAISRITGISKVKVHAVLQVQGDLYRETIVQDIGVRVPGLGTVITRVSAPAVRHNPRTLERKLVPPRRKLRIRPAQDLLWLPVKGDGKDDS